MSATGLQEFKQVLTDFRELGALAVKGTVAVPLLNVWLRYGPPPTAEIAVLTSGSQFLAAMWIFQFWHETDAKVLSRRMKLSLGASAFALLAFSVLVLQFTTSPGPKRDRVVEGYSVRSDVERVLGPGYTTQNALHDAEYDPLQVWTRDSITVIHALLVATWLAMFTCVSVFISSFIILQRRKGTSRSDLTIAT